MFQDLNTFKLTVSDAEDHDTPPEDKQKIAKLISYQQRCRDCTTLNFHNNNRVRILLICSVRLQTYVEQVYVDRYWSCLCLCSMAMLLNRCNTLRRLQGNQCQCIGQCYDR